MQLPAIIRAVRFFVLSTLGGLCLFGLAAPLRAAGPILVSIELNEQAGVFISEYRGLGFARYSNDVGLNFSFGLVPRLWLGLGGGYMGLLPSAITPASPLGLPGEDIMRLGIFTEYRDPEGLAIRLGPHFGYSQLQQTGNYLVFLGADLAASWLFTFGALGLEPGIGTSWQFRKDLPLSFNLNVQLRISFQAKEL